MPDLLSEMRAKAGKPNVAHRVRIMDALGVLWEAQAWGTDMPINERHVRLAARMYEMRETARNLSGEFYSERVQEWKDTLEKLAKQLEHRTEYEGDALCHGCLKAARKASAEGAR
jgi:hypothetical protein